jgi:hypothetical protein
VKEKKMKFKLILASLSGACAVLACQVANGDGNTGSPTQLPSTALDYSRINNNTYTYSDLAIAKSRHLSDEQIAKILKVAELTGVKFRNISEAVERGDTFTTIADDYRIRCSDLKDVQKQKDEISAFEAAYEATGAEGSRRQNISRAITSHDPEDSSR